MEQLLDEQLRALGESVEAVRDCLVAMGIRGSHRSETCPLSRYLTLRCGYDQAFVDTYNISVRVRGQVSSTSVPTPPVLRLFLALFDARALGYEQLFIPTWVVEQEHRDAQTALGTAHAR